MGLALNHLSQYSSLALMMAICVAASIASYSAGHFALSKAAGVKFWTASRKEAIKQYSKASLSFGLAFFVMYTEPRVFWLALLLGTILCTCAVYNFLYRKRDDET